MIELLTFLLAMLGYAGLAFSAVAVGRSRLSTPFWRVVVVVILAHVALVWIFRYQGQFSQATRNGYIGFAIFHSALLMILASVFLNAPVRKWLIWASFSIVTVGAIGAVFRYEIVALYRIPVLACAVLGAAGLLWTWRTRNPSSTVAG